MSQWDTNKTFIKNSLPENACCPYCNAQMTLDYKDGYSQVTIDHIKPQSKGGSDALTNLIACCASCNSRKGNRTRVTMFYLNETKSLSVQDHLDLNLYLESFNRNNTAQDAMDLIMAGKFQAAWDLIKFRSKLSRRPKFFTRLLECIAVIQFKFQEIVTQTKEILNLLKSHLVFEGKNMEVQKQKLSHLNFSTYTLISA